MRQLWFLIVLGLIAVLVAPALAKHIEWTAPASYTDNTAIEASVLAKMKYYVRTKAPNPRSSTPDGTGWYYLGETPENNTTTWPPTNDLEAGMNPGDSRTYTVSAAYRDLNGVWHESALSAPATLTVPFPEGKPPGGPGGLRIMD